MEDKDVCLQCDYSDPDVGCVCSSIDLWYACPLEPTPTEEDFITVQEWEQLQKCDK